MSIASFVHAKIRSDSGYFTALVTQSSGKYTVAISCNKSLRDIASSRLGSDGEWQGSPESYRIKRQSNSLYAAVVLARQSLAKVDRLKAESTYVWRLGGKELTIIDVGTRHAMQISHPALKPGNDAWSKLRQQLQDSGLLSRAVEFENNALEAPLKRSATNNIDGTLQKLVNLCSKIL